MRPDRLDKEFVQTTLFEIMPKTAVKRFEDHDGADFAYIMGEYGRFRVNVLRHLNGMGAVLRAIPSKALTLDELKMPKAIHTLCRANNGLILVTGKTGSGKSTTLAAMIDDINSRLKGHILTIEDPIEFVHQRKQCLMSQREVGVHSPASPTRCTRPCAKIPTSILVGELRDFETMSIAMTAAEMGMLVMGTLHTNGAAATVDRIVNVFPADKQDHVRNMLSTSLRGVVSQQLLQKADKSGRVAALEILINTSAVANLIRQGKLDQLENVMQSSGQRRHVHDGRRHQEAARQRLITGEEAYLKAHRQVQVRAVQRSGVARLYFRAHQESRFPCLARSSSRAPCRTPTTRCTSATSSSTCRPTSGCASSACRGTTCIYVCADDAHGTPIMLKAETEGITPEELIARMAAEHRARLRRLPDQRR